MSPDAPKPPYVANPGTLAKVLDKIKEAATPPRFTQDFVADTLGFKGNYALAVIPFLKRIGFLHTDGSPTDIYKRFRNDGESGRAMAEAIRIGYAALFRINERAEGLGDEAFRGLIVQVTGGKKDDSATKHIYACFKVLKARALFHDGALTPVQLEPSVDRGSTTAKEKPTLGGLPPGVGMNLSYTINLNLPASTDVAVFNAIFQSLRKNLLRDE
ncbi:MAG TPA: DUF5343 domain-containing protein [Bryobacteraceae bacterium]